MKIQPPADTAPPRETAPRESPWAPGALTADALATHPSLTLFQKILLTTDGTVTNLLSLYAGETIKAVKLEQSLQTGRPTPHLECPAGAAMLRRRIVLCGERSGTRFLFAESFFLHEAFPPAIRDGLLHTQTPIGLLWRQARFEMHRDILDCRIERHAQAAARLGWPGDTAMLSRTYAIVHSGRRLGAITEKFPAQGLR